MASRYYNRTLDCGCMYSSDGGGGLIPCSYGYGCGEKGCDENNQCDECMNQEQKCKKAHEKWHKSKDYKQYEQACIDKNSQMTKQKETKEKVKINYFYDKKDKKVLGGTLEDGTIILVDRKERVLRIAFPRKKFWDIFKLQNKEKRKYLEVMFSEREIEMISKIFQIKPLNQKPIKVKPIKVIKNNKGTFWNANDGKETYSKDIIALLNLLNINYELKDYTDKNEI